MFKGKSLQIFFINARWVILFLIFVVLILTFGVNTYIHQIETNFIRTISQKLNYSLSMGNFYYRFPNSFYFYDVGIKNNHPQDAGSSIDLNKIKVKVSIPELVSHRQILISDIKVYNSRLTYYDLQKFLTRNIEFIKNVFKNMPEGNAKIKFYDINLIFLDNKEMVLDCFFKINKDVVSGIGQVKKILYMKENFANHTSRNFLDVQRYKFRLNGRIAKDLFAINSLEFNHLNLRSKLWGEITEEQLAIKGYAVIDTFAGRKVKESSSAKTAFTPFKNFLNNDIFFFPEDQLVNPNIHILDIDTILKFHFPSITVPRFNLTINNTPINISGAIDFSDALKANMSCKVLPSSKMVFFKEAQMNARFDTSDKKNSLSGNIKVDFKKGASEYSLSQIEAYFEDMIFDLDKIIPLEVYTKKLKVTCKTSVDQHIVSIENLKSKVNNLNSELKIIDFSSPLYEGEMDGRVWVQTDKWPSDVSANIKVKGVDAHALAGLYSYFSKTYGKLDGQVNFISKKEMVLSGNLSIIKGKLVNFDFFQWLADSFAMPSLVEISFEEASTDFTINSQSVGFENFMLHSADVNMEGYYRVDSHNHVASILQLSFSQDILGESKKFKPILKMFKEDSSNLPFKFQLSGNQENVNFHWMDSPVKEKIQEKIPNFIERRIEKGIDRMISEPEPAN